mmetsp:Transcript_52481/g.87631  ORF Transcript_52481/g.87631 Transcript_52481/m.87631 type:complete len:117 (+) Transcript_52481:3-353(+)
MTEVSDKSSDRNISFAKGFSLHNSHAVLPGTTTSWSWVTTGTGTIHHRDGMDKSGPICASNDPFFAHHLPPLPSTKMAAASLGSLNTLPLFSVSLTRHIASQPLEPHVVVFCRVVG